MVFLLAFVAFIALIALFAASVWAVLHRLGRRLGERVHGLHSDAERILAGDPPPGDWSRRTRRRLARAGRNRPGVEARLRRRVRRRLVGLARYFRSAPVFEDEASRRALLRGLEEAGRRWDEQPVERLLGADGGPEDPPRPM